MLNPASKAWAPYAAGAVIGLLQIPTFLLMDTALGASSSFVTVAAHIASLFDARVTEVKDLASHLWVLMAVAGSWWSWRHRGRRLHDDEAVGAPASGDLTGVCAPRAC